ncbi:adenine deaminase C-terminal domain-containing protein [Paenibacillus polymyxa]|jgi:adenine deaminase|uniref:adenine deaminase C-terminal domain-containing protein n=1 Tax=Paenibacillus TaxID=44249 RepID=UPI0002D72E03|nr:MULTISPECIES: adenine deaminase C-terminal domain-containing protein [Paenibacillus]KAF6657009.1 amidohydrolase family protein [Paenibacillus sp. EKM301P]MBY0022191.1 amidohydrolase family protein [Paenibacillus polymyxa]MBY0058034.1 amidohydrolase family protein [Paenibacillus polymyxa]MBY0068647.1 amidohydrolase family protein [Paenibacillus polymyxa]MBY0079214.1 amidohydrolase family protein [Paenibacillus polymyxa]
MRADKMILQVKVYNSYYKTFEEGNVAILDGKFMYIGQRGLESFEAAEIVEGHGKYMIPGLIDIHLHIESTMVTPATFSYGLIRNGVTTIVPEPHEMANVFGLEGIQEMMEASKDCVADMFYGIPSSVPATPLETSGGEIDIPEIDALLQTGEMICLGEIMNYVDVIRDPESKTNRILRHVRENYPELIIEGHTPQLLDLDLHQLIYAGIGSDHTHQSIEGMKARMAAGMFIEIQEKSMTPEVMDYLIQEDVAQHFCFVTDDVMPDSFVERGHLNHIVSKAIGMGMKPEDAIYAATYTPAARMRMHDRGTIAPGKIADFVLLSDLEQFDVEQVYKDGLKVFDKFEEYHQAPVKSCFPAHFYRSVKLNPLTEQDFTVKLDVGDGAHPCRIMMVKDGSTFTSERIAPAQVEQGELVWEHGEHGLIATFERYGKNGNRAYGLIGGDTIKRGAVATTYSHDNHNLLVVGHNKQDMILAANTVLSSQGGFCVVENGKVLSHLPLTVGGILTEGPLEMVAAHVKELRSALLSLGYRHYNPIMSLSTHSLPVSPALKITDHGLIDVNAGKVVSLIVEPSEI